MEFFLGICENILIVDEELILRFVLCRFKICVVLIPAFTSEKSCILGIEMCYSVLLSCSGNNVCVFCGKICKSLSYAVNITEVVAFLLTCGPNNCTFTEFVPGGEPYKLFCPSGF